MKTTMNTIKRSMSGFTHDLQKGNLRFRKHQRIHPRQCQDRVRELSKGQSPSTILVSCSDSRIAPEIVFDQGLGDLFSIRTAGHVLDAVSVASIEYAVGHLGAKEIVVMGHTSCGAIKAAVASGETPDTGSKNLDALILAIKPGLKKEYHSDHAHEEAAEDNVAASIRFLLSKSPLIRDEVHQGKVKIVSALYDLETGEVEIW